GKMVRCARHCRAQHPCRLLNWDGSASCCARFLLVWRHQGRNYGFGDLRAINYGFAGKFPDAAALLQLRDVQFQLVAWNHGLAELGGIDGHEIDDRRRTRARIVDADRACRLCHRLDDEHAGHDRLVRKMTLEVRLVHRHVLDADGRVVAIHLNDPVNQQKRVAVRQQPHQLGNIDTFQRLGRVLYHRFYFPFRFPSARLRKAAISRNACRMGCAGDPAQRSPAGMSCITPLPAASCARSPIVMWSAMPTRPPSITISPIVTDPDMPVFPAITQERPIFTLCATCTRLSILLPSPMIVSDKAPRSTVVFAPISTSFWMTTRPICGFFSRPFGPGRKPKPSCPTC